MVDYSTETEAWDVSILPDPLLTHHLPHHRHHGPPSSNGVNPNDKALPSTSLSSMIVSASISTELLFQSSQSEVVKTDFQAAGKWAQVALVDFLARKIADRATEQVKVSLPDGSSLVYSLQPLDQALTKNRRRRRNVTVKYPPYVLERSDIWCTAKNLCMTVRIFFHGPAANKNDVNDKHWVTASKALLSRMTTISKIEMEKIMEHVACVTLQERLRIKIAESSAIAFIADGSILPRKSGTSDEPMASPPAIPFQAPAESSMTTTVEVEIGAFSKYLPAFGGLTTIALRGLLVPAGITLICGGGYHGKSTMLQTIASGVYNKIPGDGREYCVSISDAVSVRAEDGRYVQNCNISAFISNLPTPPGATQTVDTRRFSTRDSSGSTSQAANVSEAIEMGCRAMLIDEDICAANFMARDGRMRSLVMDESITPLLYRVNGLFSSKGISSVVVVGGVGDWLDVPHNVILLDKYVASDATAKARSISKQFSHGHVEYGGRGVVHRLDWENSGTPIPRRPLDSFSQRFLGNVYIAVMDGGSALSLHQDEIPQTDMDLAMDDDDEGCIEASRLEQLLGKKQLFGCGLCVLWILQKGVRNPVLGLPHLLDKLDEKMDEGGLLQIIQEVNLSSVSDCDNGVIGTNKWKNIIEEVGFAYRPRKYEVGQALTRMYGIQFEEIAMEIDTSEEEAKKEAARRKEELLKIWENRRKPAKSRFE